MAAGVRQRRRRALLLDAPPTLTPQDAEGGAADDEHVPAVGGPGRGGRARGISVNARAAVELAETNRVGLRRRLAAKTS